MPIDDPAFLATDAINSANLFLSSAGAGNKIEHTTETYLGEANSRVHQAFASNRVRDEAKNRADAADKRAADEELAGEEARRRGEGGAERPAAHSCNTALACNRATTGKFGRSEMYITGIVAATCVHGVPAMELAIAMMGPEEHYYYDMLLRAAFGLRPDLKAIYLDLACRYHHRFRGLMEDLARDGKITDAAAVQILLPWMHGFDHDLECQLRFSGMYTVSSVVAACVARSKRISLTWPRVVPVRFSQEGAGRRIGEQTEQLWSLIKPFCKKARYMTKAHWHDALNAAFWMLTLRKQGPAPAVLEGRVKQNRRHLGELREGLGTCAN